MIQWPGILPGYTPRGVLRDVCEVLGLVGGRWGDALQRSDSDASIDNLRRCTFAEIGQFVWVSDNSVISLCNLIRNIIV